jgi:transcription elongation factor Elf1
MSSDPSTFACPLCGKIGVRSNSLLFVPRVIERGQLLKRICWECAKRVQVLVTQVEHENR